jgi:hypothetical protein
MTNENPFGEVIFSYTRKQAIADGVLVDLSQIEVTEQHWKHHLACTSTVWSIIEQALQTPGQDVNGIVHDISVMAKLAIRNAREVEQVFFKVIIVEQTHTFKLHIGPSDEGEAVLTLMLPNED